MNVRTPNRNLPNILSFIRLLMVPLFVWLFFSGLPLWAAGTVFLLAGITDVLDGHIARKYGFITKLGRVIDPLADKLMQVSAFACLAIAKIIPVWVISILAAKEFCMMLGAALMLRKVKDVPPSNKFGKAASALFYFITLAVIIFDMSGTLQVVLLGGALALSVLAMVIYYIQAKRYAAKK